MLSVLTFRTPDEAIEKANNTPYGLSAGVWTEKGSRILWMARAAARRRRLGEHVQPVRPDLAVRRLQGVRLRPRGRPARARRRTWSSSDMSRLPVRKTYKLYIGGAFPRSESGRTYEAEGAERRAAPRARTCATRCARRAARSRAGRRATAYNRGQVLYRVAEMLEGAPGRARRQLHRRRAEVDAAIDRVVWYAGWADKLAQVLGASNPVAGPVLQLHRAGADGRRRRSSRPRSRRSPASSRGSRRCSSAATRPSCVASEAPPARRGRAGRGARDLRRPGRRRQPPHRPQAPSWRRSSPRTWT